MRTPSTGFRSAGRGRDASPDSAIFTNDSNFSLFSSASASVERCSFASDSIDPPDSLASQFSLQLAGSEDSGSSNSDHHESSSGPDRRNADPNKPFTVRNSNKKKKNHSRTRSQCRFSKKGDKTKATIIRNEDIEEDSTQLPDSVCQLPDSARSSFSLAVKECQERRSRSEFIKKLDRQRPASLDLNNVVVGSSPRTLKKDSIQPRKSVPFPSPGTPIYCHTMQKGWSSERVPLHVNGNRRSGNGAALMPLGNNVKTLPSKWEDAERWICSPVSGDGLVRTSIPPQQRRPKSKSGPLGPPGIAYYSLFSPALPVSERGNFGSLTSSSPFSAGVITADGFAIQSNGHGSTFPMRTEPCMARSVSVHGCTEMVPYDSLPSQDENGIKDAAIDASRAVSRRDMATQMSPEGSNHSSPARTPSFSTMTPSALPIVELQSFHSSKLDVKDVQVDEKVTMTRWSKKHRNRNNGSITEVMDDWRKRSLSGRSSAWDASETTKSISKVKREEAKITAWENLQKAKAEAAIRKLEMKLEKTRSSSMDKIMNKLRSAQKQAQEMRNSVLANQAHQDSRTSHKALSLRRSRQMSSLSGCFTCHAF